jgi:hypothetical protein
MSESTTQSIDLKYVCTYTCKKYSVSVFCLLHITYKTTFFETLFQIQFLINFWWNATRIKYCIYFHYIFHTKPHYSKVNSFSILMNFLQTKARVYALFFYSFWNTGFKYSRFKYKLKLFVFESTIIYRALLKFLL